MTEWEINDIIANLPYLDRNLWESSRLNAWVTARCNGNDMTMQEVTSFKWEDNDNQETHNTEISDEDIERLRKKAQSIRLC